MYALPERVGKTRRVVRENVFTLLFHYFCFAGCSDHMRFTFSKDLYFDYNLLNMQAKGTEAVQYEMKIIENAKRASWNAALIAGQYSGCKGKSTGFSKPCLPSEKWKAC